MELLQFPTTASSKALAKVGEKIIGKTVKLMGHTEITISEALGL